MTPEFAKAAMKVVIEEGGHLIGETVYHVKATDGDEPGTPNSRISFRFLNEYPQFSIDASTGMITLVKGLDRESQDSYELLVVAEDNGMPKKLSSVAVLTVKVLDKNDNRPVFDLESGSDDVKYRMVKIPEDWPIGAVVTRVVAKDADLGLAGTVRYSIVEGHGDDFALDDISGVLRVQRQLDYQATPMYNISIRARDMGTPTLETIDFLVVEVGSSLC